MLEKMSEMIAEQLNCAEDLTDMTTVGAVMDYLKDKGVEA